MYKFISRTTIVLIIDSNSSVYLANMNQRQPLRNLSINQRPGGMNANDILLSDEYLELGMLFLTLGRFFGLRMIAPVFRLIGLVYLAEYIEINSVQMQATTII